MDVAQQPPNNPIKLPVNVVGAVLALAAIVFGVIGARQGAWVLLLVAVPMFLLFVLSIRAIAQGRNPRWNRAPLDTWFAGRRR